MSDSPPPSPAFATLCDLLRYRAALTPNRRAYLYLADGEAAEAALDYAQLNERATALAHRLTNLARPGDRALLLYPPGLEFLVAFFGCLLAGLIAVPSYPPKRNRADPRLAVIADDADAALVLTDAAVLAEIGPRLENTPSLRARRWLATNLPSDGADLAAVATLPVAAPTDLAFLQYTSGSTATPKGVMVSHANLLHNLDDLDRGWEHDESSVMVTWLPIFHDMGLIYGALMPLYRGFPCVMMPPASFLQRPLRWLEAISHHRGTHSAAPNFAYDLCVAGTTPEQRAALDLSCWRMSLNAAEPVRAATLAAFNEAFAPAGLDPLTVKPGFGLAEATLKVSALPRSRPVTVHHLDGDALARHEVVSVSPDHPAAAAHVGCGWGQVDNRALIVDPDTGQPCPPERVGEIWFAGPSVAQGYWQRPDATAETFQATLADSSGPWMRTGDLGFVADGEIFVTGRIKDLIILRGLNHYPQDIELTVERAHPAIRPGCTAAFAVSATGGDALVVVAEIERTHLRRFDKDAVVTALRTAITTAHDLPVHTLVFLKPAAIPKTSSGKIQRRRCRTLWESGELAPIATWTRPGMAADARGPVGPATHRIQELETWVVRTMAGLLSVDPGTIDPTAPFAAQGLDSLAAVELSGALEDHLGQRLSPTLAYDFPHVRALATHLARGQTKPAATPDVSPLPPHEPIAVIGLGCRLPGASSPDAFWQLLGEGRDAIGPVPSDRWDAATGEAPPFGGFLDAVDGCDAPFFGLSAREADLVDPQHRILWEVAWEALEHAGIEPASLAGSPTGVFVGISTHDYRLLLARSPHGTAAHAGTGNALSIAANRLSYWLDLRGPSLALDTACSSSLVALHHAVRALRGGDIDLALVGGVNLLLAPDVTATFAAAGMLAPDGRCKTFDAAADGYVRGEGAGVVILKPLSAARRDGDRVLCVVQGSAVNQDGRSNGLTAPNGPAQQAVMHAALRDARLAPADLSFVETHGTGTALGDPIEVNALHAVLAPDRPAHSPCHLGAVKTQFGHLEAAAGIAGFIKTVLALHHGAIPGNLHLRQPNPHLAATAPVLALPTSLTPWTTTPRHAGVSSFGFGGTNAHVILGGAPAEPAVPATPRRVEPYVVSARSSTALTSARQRHTSFLGDLSPADWADAAYTSTAGRAAFNHRVAVVATSPAAAAQALADAPPTTVTRAPRIAFLFSGQGSLSLGAARELREAQPVFAAALATCREQVQSLAGWDLLGALDSSAQLDRTEFAQVALFSLEYALAQLWRAWGITPYAVAGHSVGEFAAAVTAGVMDLPDALGLLLTRAKLMGALGEHGAMAAIMADHATVAPLAAAHGVEIAALNAPRQIVVSGPASAVAAILDAARDAGLRVAPLPVRQAYHSAAMEPMLTEFGTAAARTVRHLPELVFVSSYTGQAVTTELTTADYWTQQIRQPVRWADAVTSLAATGCDLILEIGPRNLLTSLSQASWPEAQPATWLASLGAEPPDWPPLLTSAARAWELGAPVDWRAVHAGFPRRKITLPTYPFQRERHWFSDTITSPAAAPPRHDDIHYELAWQPAPLAPTSAAASGKLLVMGPDLGLTFDRSEAFQPGDWDQVVHVVGDASAAAECARLLATARALLAAPGQARLRVVTRGAVATVPLEARSLRLPHAAVWGMGLAFGLEHPERWAGLIDLPATPLAGETAALTDELGARSPEDQVALRPARFVARLHAATPPPPAPFALQTEASYWITGGLGGIGLHLATGLAAAGARHLILSSRRPPSASAQATLDGLAAQGVEVRVVALDIADVSAVTHLLDEAEREGRPVRGILHAAGVMHNQVLAEITPESLAEVLHPKVAGGLTLHQATARRELDFLVFFSSIAAVWGSKWQLPYAAANRFLDALAHHRRATALPALSVNWGPWAGGGMAGEEEQQLLRRLGITALAPARCMAALAALMAAGRTQAVVARVDWAQFLSLVELHRSKPLLEELEPRTAASPSAGEPVGPPPLVTTWTALPPAERFGAMQAWARGQLAAVLGWKDQRLPDPREGFFALGIDSILAVEFRNRLARALGQNFPATLAFDHANLVALTTHLIERLWPPNPVQPSPPAVPTPPAPAEPTTYPDDLDAALADRLARLESLTRAK